MPTKNALINKLFTDFLKQNYVSHQLKEKIKFECGVHFRTYFVVHEDDSDLKICLMTYDAEKNLFSAYDVYPVLLIENALEI